MAFDTLRYRPDQSALVRRKAIGHNSRLGSQQEFTGVGIVLPGGGVLRSDGLPDEFFDLLVDFLGLPLFVAYRRRVLGLVLANGAQQGLLRFHFLLHFFPCAAVFGVETLLLLALRGQVDVQFGQRIGLDHDLLALLPAEIGVLFDVLQPLKGLKKALGRKQEHQLALLYLALISLLNHQGIIFF